MTDVRVCRGDVFWNLKKYEDALKDYSKALQIDEANIEALYKRARVYMRLALVDKAKSDVLRADQLIATTDYDANRLIKAYIDCGVTAYKENCIELALEFFNKACKSAPRDPIAQNNRAFILFHLGRLSEAAAAWKQAVESQNAPHYAFAGYAVALWRLQQIDEAVEQYSTAVKLDARWQDNIYRIAEQYMWNNLMINSAAGIVQKMHERRAIE